MPYKLGRKTLEVLEVIDRHWPTNAVDIGKILSPKNKNIKSLSGRYMHHIKRLREANLIHARQMGSSVVVWPKSVDDLKEKLEKLRKIREIADSL